MKFFIDSIHSIDIQYVLHHALQLALRVPKWNVFIYSIHSIDIQYVLHHALQLALRVPKWNVFYRFNTFNIHSICIAPCFAIFQCIFIVCEANDSYSLTYSHTQILDMLSHLKIDSKDVSKRENVHICQFSEDRCETSIS